MELQVSKAEKHNQTDRTEFAASMNRASAAYTFTIGRGIPHRPDCALCRAALRYPLVLLHGRAANLERATPFFVGTVLWGEFIPADANALYGVTRVLPYQL